MYCIISLPRSASKYAWNLVNHSLIFTDPRHKNDTPGSVFNPRFNTEDEIENKFHQIMSSNPLPVVKIVSNHDFNMVHRFIDSDYKTIFIKPTNFKKQVLKILVAKKTDTFDRRRIDNREDYLGKVEITEDDILERFGHYKQHMEFENLCDYVVTDKFIIENPQEFQKSLGLTPMRTKFRYERYKYTDEEMVADLNEYNNIYDKLSINFFGEII